MLKKQSRFAAACLLALMVVSMPSSAQQIADTMFQFRIDSPAFREGAGPLVLIDEGHTNFHTMNGRYLPFARLVQRDGYVVEPQKGRFARMALNRAKILVIANALAKENESEWSLPTPSALDSEEIALVHGWVSDGGSLLLIADHMPFAGAAAPLAAEFGILMANGFALDPATQDGRLPFTRSSGALASHPITQGRSPAERVDSIVSFTGQAFRLEGRGEPLMTIGHGIVLYLPQVAWQFSRLTPGISASQMLQGAVLKVGKGRVAVFGEAAMFSAQVAGPNRVPMGMNDPRAPQNPRFLLNVMHWLSGLL